MFAIGVADLQRGVPRREHRQVVLVEVVDRLGVVGRQLLVGDLVDPRADELAQQLPASLAADGLGDDADGVLGLDEAQGHGVKVRARPDGKNRAAPGFVPAVAHFGSKSFRTVHDHAAASAHFVPA